MAAAKLVAVLLPEPPEWAVGKLYFTDSFIKTVKILSFPVFAPFAFTCSPKSNIKIKYYSPKNSALCSRGVMRSAGSLQSPPVLHDGSPAKQALLSSQKTFSPPSPALAMHTSPGEMLISLHNSHYSSFPLGQVYPSSMPEDFSLSHLNAFGPQSPIIDKIIANNCKGDACKDCTTQGRVAENSWGCCCCTAKRGSRMDSTPWATAPRLW